MASFFLFKIKDQSIIFEMILLKTNSHHGRYVSIESNIKINNII